MKILNLYAGIGGNRKLWTPNGDEHEITAIEQDHKIAAIYRDLWPNDKIISTDAHQYLLKHFEEFDFIWSSPPCPTHSQLRKGFSMANGAKAVYPDMKLYEEIIFLQGYFKGKWVVENVVSWYEPLIAPQLISRHYYWANFLLPNKNLGKSKINLTGGWEKQDDKMQIEQLEKDLGFDLSVYEIPLANKCRMLRNCVEPEIGKHILDFAITPIKLQSELF